MTVRHIISEESELKGIVSPASVFTVIHQWIQGEVDKTGCLPISQAELAALKNLTRKYLEKNLLMVKECVAPELQSAARELLCEYWGGATVRRGSGQATKRSDLLGSEGKAFPSLLPTS